MDHNIPATVGLVLLLCGFAVGGAGSAPQTGAGTRPLVEVSLQQVSAVPGQDLTVPIALEVEGPNEVASLTFVVSFPPVLTFDTASPAYTLRELDGSVAASPVPDEARRLEVRVRSAATPLLPGVLGYLVFRVAPDAPLGPLAVEISNLRVEDAGGGEVSPARLAVKGITLMDPKDAVIPACFFYMH